MARINLTEKVVAKLKAPDPSGKQKLYWDDKLRGFGVLCSGTTNAKTYVVQRDLPDGRTRRVTVGAVNVLKLDSVVEGKDKVKVPGARELAERILADMYQGIDPKAGRRGARTLRETLDDYLAATKDLSEKTRDDYEASVTRHLAAWLDCPLREITADMVEERHRDIQRTIATRAEQERAARAINTPAKALLRQAQGMGGDAAATLTDALRAGDTAATARAAQALARAAGLPLPEHTEGPVQVNGAATANGAMRVLRVLWNFAAERTEMPANPVKRLRRQWYAVPRRERLVRAEELSRFYAAVAALPNPIARDYLLLLLFTGLRREEAASLTWDDVDFTERVIRLPASRTKAGRKLDLPMSDYVRDLLVARRAIGKEKFVFTSDSVAGYIAEPKFPLGLVADACGVKVSAHDLRRTFITVAESTDISPMALKALVNHALGQDVTSGYVVMNTERLRDPAQRVCDRMKALCGITPAAGNVKRIQ